MMSIEQKRIVLAGLLHDDTYAAIAERAGLTPDTIRRTAVKMGFGSRPAGKPFLVRKVTSVTR
jgi:hypothetical protein